MGNQIGPVHLSGKIGDIVFYVDSEGRPRFRKAVHSTKSKVKKGANYALTRKGNDEFTGAARAVHSLRMCLGERMGWYSDRHFGSRMMKLCRGVIVRGPGFMGQRRFEVGPHADSFRQLELSKRAPLHRSFSAPFTVTVNPDRNTATVDVPAFHTDSYLGRPTGATHFKLTLVAGVLSDHAYVGGEALYEPVDADLNGLSVTVVSTAMAALNSVTAPLQLVAALPGLPVLPSTSCLVVSIGIDFFQIISNYEEPMAQGNAMRIVDVY